MANGLAMREPTVALMREVAQQLATLPSERFGEAMEFLETISKAVEGLRTTFGSRVEETVITWGTRTTEKGTMEWVTNGYLVRASPTRTGTDPKKLEAKLRAKGIDPSLHMDSKVTFAVNERKLGVLLAAGLVTEAEVEACKYELNYRLSVKRVETNESTD